MKITKLDALDVLVLMVALMVGGCSTIPREVEVPIAVPCPAPRELPPLVLPLETLRSGSPAEKIRTFALIIEMQKIRIDSLEKLLDGYRVPAKPALSQ